MSCVRNHLVEQLLGCIRQPIWCVPDIAGASRAARAVVSIHKREVLAGAATSSSTCIHRCFYTQGSQVALRVQDASSLLNIQLAVLRETLVIARCARGKHRTAVQLVQLAGGGESNAATGLTGGEAAIIPGRRNAGDTATLGVDTGASGTHGNQQEIWGH